MADKKRHGALALLEFNTIAAGVLATIGGGYTNTASGDDSFIGGGVNHTASGWRSTLGGGYSNTATVHSRRFGTRTLTPLASSVRGVVRSSSS